MSAHALSMQLKRERDILELLLLKLDVQQLLVAAGRTCGIHQAMVELERVVSAMPMAALSRDALVTAVADEWGAPDAATLKELITSAPTAAWKEIFTEYLVTMLTLVVEIRQMEALNQQHLRAALLLAEEAAEEDPAGTPEDVDSLEEVARLQADAGTFQAALRLTDKTLQVNLLEFLR